MNKQFLRVLMTTAGFLVAAPLALAADVGLPGDHGRPGNGVWPLNPRVQGTSPGPPTTVPALSIKLALDAAQAIAQGCKQYHFGLTIVNSKGEPTLVYTPDGSNATHAYMAQRKAYTALTFKVPTSQLVTKAQQDPDFAAKIGADPNLLAWSGGLPLMVGDEVIGAIGVSGAEPGHHDEECGLIGLAKIKKQLK